MKKNTNLQKIKKKRLISLLCFIASVIMTAKMFQILPSLKNEWLLYTNRIFIVLMLFVIGYSCVVYRICNIKCEEMQEDPNCKKMSKKCVA